MPTRVRETFTEFDAADCLRDREDILGFLQVVFEEGDLGDLRSALDVVARSKGMTDVAKQTGITREALYKALGPKGNPTLETLYNLIKALGFRLTVADPAATDLPKKEAPLRKVRA